MKTEDFPISDKVLDKWIENVQKTVSHNKIETRKYIYINLSMVRLQTAWVMPKILFALGMAERTGAKIAVITWRPNPRFSRLLEAYGVEHISLEKLCRTDFRAFFSSVVDTIGIILKGGSGTVLKNMTFRSIPAGRAIYEDILRTSELSTIRSFFNAVCIKKTLHLMWMMHSLDHYLNKYSSLFCVTDDLAYHEGMQLALFRIHGADMVNVSNVGMGKVSFDDRLRTIRWHYINYQYCHEHISEVGDDAVKRVDVFLAERFAGNNGRNIDRGAFKGKKVWSREDGVRELGLDPSKKNIVIMAHTFTDAVFNYGDTPFRDYYDWTEQTLRAAGTIDDVNWILKPHPTRKAYHESVDSIEAMYGRYKRDNIFLLSDEVSAESIKNIADAIITIGGNAGAEFACFGIPAVIVGNPYYKGFGYTIEPKSLTQYENCLKKLSKIKPLSGEQVVMAKKVFYLKNIRGKGDFGDGFNDDFAQLLKSGYTKMLDEMAMEYFENNDGTQGYNDAITLKVCEYFSEKDYKDTEYYRAGKAMICV